ncbi:Aldo keto reductase [Hymenopellis radicata]|nr:Aldo keto reductase [Hymenopellis radicata]
MAETTGKKIEYVRLGNSGLKVSKIIMGCMSFGSPAWYDWVLDADEGVKHIKAAYDAGINAFDTADVYSNGESEKILGKAIKQYDLPREEIVVLTKVWGAVSTHNVGDQLFGAPGLDSKGYANQHGLSRKHIFHSVKNSLERLGLDYIDVLQCHRFDYNTPIEETMQALHDVVKAGWVRYIGMSSCHAYQFHIMQNYAITRHLTPFISMQNHYSLVYREEEREMFPTLQHFGVGSIPWSPLARGLLTRPLCEQTKRGTSDRVEEIAKKRGLTMAQLALAWVLSRPGVAAPIVGTSSIENLKELIAATHITLTDEEKEYLEEPYQTQAVFGHS